MKNAWKEYLEIVKLSTEWTKKHWKGYLIITLILSLPELIMIGKNLYESHKLSKKHEEFIAALHNNNEEFMKEFEL